ncbi:hypothetical protein CYMTET_7688 [Cymbomonas tetramitiformis]|uniref:Uncharacterized protein n=1 Tax=Cymbomonas tetramitiformis TaxID=36881 RepID=A0AAE0GV00_9CHLO|nr:hypothetical protein CYMTET_7688 [Cymbomonas tetramitiformis]
MRIEASDIGSEVSDNDHGSDNDSDGGQHVAFGSFGTLEHDSDGGALPAAGGSLTPMYRPRTPPSFLRCALMSSVLCCSLLASATASLVAVGGGDRGLVEPGATARRSTGDLFASLPPLGAAGIRDWPPDDGVLLSPSSKNAQTAVGFYLFQFFGYFTFCCGSTLPTWAWWCSIYNRQLTIHFGILPCLHPDR